MIMNIKNTENVFKIHIIVIETVFIVIYIFTYFFSQPHRDYYWLDIYCCMTLTNVFPASSVK